MLRQADADQFCGRINVGDLELASVSEADAGALKKVFNIKTIGDLADNKCVSAAAAFAEMANYAK